MPKTYVDFRFSEADAARYLPPGVGRMLGDSVRRIDVPIADPLYERIGELTRSRRGKSFTSFDIRRRYTAAELDAAEVLLWEIHSRFEPTGEMCGTVYDTSTACRRCRVGRTQRSELVLDLKRLPKKDVAISLSGEIVVSDRFADLLVAGGMTGVDLRPVRDARGRASRAAPPRFQLLATPPPIPILIPPTTFGTDPFDLDGRGRFRCPLGHVVGLNRLTEVTLERVDWPGRDLVATREHVGDPGWIGELYPEPMLLISPRLYRLIRDERVTGSRVEVAYLT